MNNDLDRELQDLKKLPSLSPVKATEPVREVKPMSANRSCCGGELRR
jgi:hypothetical protein